MDDQHVVGIDVSAVRFVAALGKKCSRVAESRRMRAIQSGGQGVDLGLEDIETLENAGRTLREMLLQHAMIDEFDAPTLNHFVQSRAREIDRGSRLKQVKVVEIEQWIVQMPPQVGERKQALVRDETGSVNVARGMGRRQRFLEEEITNPALHRREFHGRLGRAEGKLLGTASQQ